ncbi:uncharacterized protein LAJ45_08464 [Morchella importuna]|uniref:uncharacterized protein n=1 Tax=Morchella importuna TaxID=1174673 RepID=UPI001E8D3DD4|nr:uncharacterized protein LAJ45_08464 [Morchella importuna]KAH8147636.1 hypothetical protein LAJ45_08464 [Morchella importuna]
MQFSTILIATAALAMTVIAAPVAGDDKAHTEIHDSGNVGDISQSGNHNVCSNQQDRTTQVCCNKSDKSSASGLVALDALNNVLSDACFLSDGCKADQKTFCCKQENSSNGINLVQLNSCGPLIEAL